MSVEILALVEATDLLESRANWACLVTPDPEDSRARRVSKAPEELRATLEPKDQREPPARSVRSVVPGRKAIPVRQVL